MEQIQQFFTGWVSDFASLLPVGYAFGAGMVSTVNPCGFAMLPAYLGLFVGASELRPVPVGPIGSTQEVTRADAMAGQLAKAVLVATVVTGGFVLLFGVAGAIISAGGQLVVEFVPWIALAIGAVLAALGVAMLRGFKLSSGLPARIAAAMGNTQDVGLRGFLVFGIAYALASLSCTLPIFLTVVGGSLAVDGYAAAAFQFVSYALGMGLVILLLTVTTAVFKGSVTAWLRTGLPYAERFSAVLLMVAGSYIVYYWLFKGRLIDEIF